MAKIIICFLTGVLMASCGHATQEEFIYLQDKTISNNQGTPVDSLAFYYPASIKRANQIVKVNLDSFSMNWYSSVLYSANEPILYNYYLRHPIYRFLWLRSFHKPIVFIFNRKNDKVWLTIKELDKQPIFTDLKYRKAVLFTPPKNRTNKKNDTIEYNIDETYIDSIVKADRKVKIILNQTIQLTLKEWAEFELLLSESNFWIIQPHEKSSGLDGSEWIIEAHQQNRYWFVNRWSPEGNFRKSGEYLIKKSGLKEEIY